MRVSSQAKPMFQFGQGKCDRYIKVTFEPMLWIAVLCYMVYGSVSVVIGGELVHDN